MREVIQIVEDRVVDSGGGEVAYRESGVDRLETEALAYTDLSQAKEVGQEFIKSF